MPQTPKVLVRDRRGVYGISQGLSQVVPSATKEHPMQYLQPLHPVVGGDMLSSLGQLSSGRRWCCYFTFGNVKDSTLALGET